MALRASGEQRIAGVGGIVVTLARRIDAQLRESKGGVADHPLPVAGGVAGIAQVQQVRLQVMAARGQQQAVDRCGAAGLLVVERSAAAPGCVCTVPRSIACACA